MTSQPTCLTAVLEVAMEGERLQGCSIIARCLRGQGVQYVFGIVGIPVVELGVAFQDAGVHYIGTRNEQAVSMHLFIETTIFFSCDRCVWALPLSICSRQFLLHAVAELDWQPKLFAEL